jgi:ribosome-associated protein
MKKVQQKHQEKTGLEVATLAAQTALDKKAEDLVILDVRGIASFADFFVIMSGRSTRHVQGLAEAVDAELRQKKITSSNTEGLNEGHWVLLDYSDVLVHIFYSETRQFYDLEGLWHDAPRIAIEESEPVKEIVKGKRK